MHFLDLDLYKLTMQQMVYHQFPDAFARFRLINRGQDGPLFIGHEKLYDLSQLKATKADVKYLKSLGYFKGDYLEYIQERPKVSVAIEIDEEGMSYSGMWSEIILLETRILTTLSQHKFNSDVQKLQWEYPNIDLKTIFKEAYARADVKAQILAGKGCKFMEFGTRRRASLEFQEHVVGVMHSVCGDSFIGTSNVMLAQKLDIAPKGTFAHEAVMSFGLQKNANTLMLEAWKKEYGEFPELMIALTDTYGSIAFFREYFEQKLHEHFKVVRQDSGNPFQFGNLFISLLQHHNLNPSDFTIVFSDGLNVNKMIQLQQAFGHIIRVSFGIGTNLTYDNFVSDYYGPPQYVIKMDQINHSPVCKLSDTRGKFTGDKGTIEQAIDLFDYRPLE